MALLKGDRSYENRTLKRMNLRRDILTRPDISSLFFYYRIVSNLKQKPKLTLNFFLIETLQL